MAKKPKKQNNAPIGSIDSSAVSEKTAPDRPAAEKKPWKRFILGIYAALLITAFAVSAILADSQYSPKSALRKSIHAKENLDVTAYADVSYYVNFFSNKTKDAYISESRKKLDADPAYCSEQREINRSISYSDVSVVELSQDELDFEKNRLKRSGCFSDTDRIKDILVMCYTESEDGIPLEKSCYAIRVGSRWYIEG